MELHDHICMHGLLSIICAQVRLEMSMNGSAQGARSRNKWFIKIRAKEDVIISCEVKAIQW